MENNYQTAIIFAIIGATYILCHIVAIFLVHKWRKNKTKK